MKCPLRDDSVPWTIDLIRDSDSLAAAAAVTKKRLGQYLCRMHIYIEMSDCRYKGCGERLARVGAKK